MDCGAALTRSSFKGSLTFFISRFHTDVPFPSQKRHVCALFFLIDMRTEVTRQREKREMRLESLLRNVGVQLLFVLSWARAFRRCCRAG